MSATIENLPIEILTKILKNISNRRKLSLLSKQLNAANSLLDENDVIVSVNCDDLESSPEYFNKLLEIQKFFNIEISSYNFNTQDFLKMFSENVKKVKINGNILLENYLKILKLIPNCEILDLVRNPSREIFSNDNQRDEIKLEKLEKLIIDCYIVETEKLSRFFEAPNLKTLFVKYNDRKHETLRRLFTKLNYIKELEIHQNGSMAINIKVDKIDFSFLSFLKLETLIVHSVDPVFLEFLLKSQKCLKHLKFYLFTNEINYEDLKSLETLQVDRFNGNFHAFSPLVNLKSLKITEQVTAYAVPTLPTFESKFFKGIKSMKNLKHFNITCVFLRNSNFVYKILKNFKQVESLELFKNRVHDEDFVKSFTKLKCKNLNLKSLKLHLRFSFSIPLLKALIESYENLENLDIFALFLPMNFKFPRTNYKDFNVKRKKESEKFEKVLKFFHEVKNQSDGLKIFIKKLSGLSFEHLHQNDLLKIQICIFLLGFKKLKSLKIKFDGYCNGTDEIVKSFENLKVFEMENASMVHFEPNMNFKWSGHYNRERIERSNGFEDSKNFFNRHNDEEKIITSNMLSSFGLFNSFFNTNKIIRKFKFNFEKLRYIRNFNKFTEILSIFGPYINEITLKGKIYDCQLISLYNHIPNCKKLILEEFSTYIESNEIYQVNLTQLKHLRVDSSLDDNFLKVFRLPDDSLEKVEFITKSEGLFASFNEFLSNQRKIKEVKLEIGLYCKEALPENFLAQCELEKFSVIYVNLTEEMKRPIEFLKSKHNALEMISVSPSVGYYGCHLMSYVNF